MTMALALLAASSVSVAAEPTPTSVAPAARPDPAISVEASPAVADLESLAQFSTQAQDLQRADPAAVSVVADPSRGAEESHPSLAELPPAAPSTPVEPSSPVAQDSAGVVRHHIAHYQRQLASHG